MILRSLALAVSVFGISAAAQAQESDNPRPDANRDGGPRARGPAAGPFGGRHPMLMMDTNGDGKISKEEFRKGHEAMFNRLDRNGDGVIDESERPRFPMMAGPGGPPFGPGSGPDARRPDGPPREGGPRRATPPAPRRVDGQLLERLRQLDADGDGKISRDEFKGPKEIFDRLDRNGDGVIDRNDRPTPEDRPEARRGDRDRERPRDGEAQRGEREEKRAEDAHREHKHEHPKAEDKDKEKKEDKDKGKDKEKDDEHEHEHEHEDKS